MSKIYVLFKKNIVENTSLPSFEIFYQAVEGKVAIIEPGECVDAYRCSLGDHGKHIWIEQYCVRNIDGQADIVPTESYMLERIR